MLEVIRTLMVSSKTDIKQVIVATHSSAVISNSILDEYIIPLPNSIVDREEDFNE